MNYEELVLALRICTGKDDRLLCSDCPYHENYPESCRYEASSDAAAAIEELQAALKEADKKQAYQHDCICELTAENEELQAENEHFKDMLEEIGENNNNLFRDLVNLQKQLPKRGEWKTTDAFPHRVYCSNCFRTYVPNDRWQIWVDKPGEGGLERNYCPSCGAKMEVQDA